MKLDRVTITGADNSVRPEQLIELSDEYPFVEWGILFSNNRQGQSRFPDQTWINQLTDLCDRAATGPKICSHLCGKHLVKEFCNTGDFVFQRERPDFWSHVHRVQLNFHSQKHGLCNKAISFINSNERKFIVQYDGVNDTALGGIIQGNNIDPLFDISGGNGLLPDKWPSPVKDYCGYAGGLSPENVVSQVEKIATVAGANRIWIDMETGVRSEDCRYFDIARVCRVLNAVRPFIA